MSMAEVRALEPSGLRAISFFAGTGGSSLGYRMAGTRMLWANEFVEAARDCYRANADPRTIIDGRDIRLIQPEDVLSQIGLARGDVDILDGSPPCASFSTAGKRAKGWGEVKSYSDTRQRSDDLFFEFARMVRGIQPKVFVAENVSGLIKGVAKGYFLNILEELKGCGYAVRAKLLDAQWLGVPQARQRLIFIGVRADLARAPVFPAPLPYRYSIRDALPWVSAVGGIRATGFAAGSVTSANGPSPTIMAGGGGGMNTSQFGVFAKVEPEADISRFAIGAEWDRLKPGGQSARYFQLVRPDADEPSPTITAAGGTSSLAAVTHPTEKRKFYIAELKRLCGFPDDFALSGTYSQQWERLGRAVPPVMMSHVARTVRDQILFS